MNKWIGTGRLSRNPELKHTQSNKAVCNFTIAVDRRFKVEGQPTADFIDCVAWDKTAEFVSKWFTKGKMICVDGAIQIRNWSDDDGKKHYSTEIKVDNVEFCGDKSDNSTKPSGNTKNEKIDDEDDEEDLF
jgi:single-strand DNA-binding protein